MMFSPSSAVILLVLLQFSFPLPELIQGSAFNETIAEGNWLIRFFAPWCPRCRKMEPEFNAVSDDPPIGVRVANIDCEADNALCVSLGITKYPRVRFYSNGTSLGTFEFDYNRVELNQFAQKMSQTPIITVASEKPTNLNPSASKFFTTPELLNFVEASHERASFVLVSPEPHFFFTHLAQEKRGTLSMFFHLQWPFFIPPSKERTGTLGETVFVDETHRTTIALLEQLGVNSDLRRDYLTAVREYVNDLKDYLNEYATGEEKGNNAVQQPDRDTLGSRPPPTAPALLISTSNRTEYNHRCPPFSHSRHYSTPYSARDSSAAAPAAAGSSPKKASFILPTVREMSDFFSVYQHPFLPQFTVDMARNTHIDETRTVIAVVDGSEKPESKQFRARYAEAAKHFDLFHPSSTTKIPRGHLSASSVFSPYFFFVIVDHAKFPGFTDFYNVSSVGIPDMLVINWKNRLNYTQIQPGASTSPAHGWSTERMITFLERVRSGKIRPNRTVRKGDLGTQFRQNVIDFFKMISQVLATHWQIALLTLSMAFSTIVVIVYACKCLRPRPKPQSTGIPTSGDTSDEEVVGTDDSTNVDRHEHAGERRGEGESSADIADAESPSLLGEKEEAAVTQPLRRTVPVRSDYSPINPPSYQLPSPPFALPVDTRGRVPAHEVTSKTPAKSPEIKARGKDEKRK